ncbi:TetR/AcrR family transcriptional regulator [Trinickia symbiotica]|uniref:TetR/AcrR family transcriptional regulator n=2 Tax=Burkholderiaceae TaxID=119060 RepID=A0A2T3XJZ2_9BURK|nr:TetR/AcrR family transcriptional regulator [Trinickia symbiotica]
MPNSTDAMPKAKALKHSAVRAGRPPSELAGEVDERILDAAHQVFMERGFHGASIDEIARLAHAGKPTIYARFETKEALFVAVGLRGAARFSAHFGKYATTGTTLEARLVCLGREMLERLLEDEVIDFMRLAAAEARRVPELAHFSRDARERGASAAREALLDAASVKDVRRFPAFGPDHIETTTRFYIDLVVDPLFMRALVGEGLKTLRAQIDNHVQHSVAFFLAGCRSA